MAEKSIYWLLQNMEDLPANEDWLSAQERTILDEMEIPKRREDWKLGRWTAKRITYSYLKMIDKREYQFPDLEILSADDGHPQLFVQKKLSSISISISHRANVGFCTLYPENSNIGCDLEIIEERSDAFVSDYFTFEEKLKVIVATEEDEALIANLIWSAKESVLKALRKGLKSDTRSVSIDLNNIVIKEGWNEIRARSLEFNQDFWGWWRREEKYILTIFSSEPTDEPTVIPN